MERGAIYHFTNGSEKRPIVFQKQLAALREFARENDLVIENTYFDYSLNKCEREQFEAFMKKLDLYNVLVVKDFYHIAKNTIECMRILKVLRENNVEVHTVENGIFTMEKEPFDKPLRVATYNCRFGRENKTIEVQNMVFSLFVKEKTRWTILDMYSDVSDKQLDGEQVELQELIKQKDEYDLILVKNLNDIHWRTSKFCKIREQLGLDIYSLQDGFLKYRKEI